MTVRSTDSRNGGRGWLGELTAFATNPLLLSLLLVSLVPLALMGYATYKSASASLDEESRNKLQVVREITVKQVERYFAGLRDQLEVLADDPSTKTALADFRAGFQTLLQDETVTEADQAQARGDLEAWYAGEFVPRYKSESDKDLSVNGITAVLGDIAVRLQDLYIRRNDNPLGSKDLLDAASDATAYTKAHGRHHPRFRNVLRKFGLYDIFLIDADSGDIIYTVFKEIDFATSLRNGAPRGDKPRESVPAGSDRGTKRCGFFRTLRPVSPLVRQTSRIPCRADSRGAKSRRRLGFPTAT